MFACIQLHEIVDKIVFYEMIDNFERMTVRMTERKAAKSFRYYVLMTANHYLWNVSEKSIFCFFIIYCITSCVLDIIASVQMNPKTYLKLWELSETWMPFEIKRQNKIMSEI